MQRFLKKATVFLLILMLWIHAAGHGLAEAKQAETPLYPWVEMLRSAFVQALHTVVGEKEDYPKLIDRWTDPDTYPDFHFSSETDLLHIWFPRIRDRDAAVFLYQDECWMLDCSDEQAEARVVPMLKALGITRIDRLINTHPHHDHLNGFYAVDAACPVSELMICFPRDINNHMINAVNYARENRITVTSFGDEQVFCMGDGVVRFQCWMKSAEKESMNDRSAQFMISYGSCDILFMADMETRGQEQLMAAVDADDLKADILRYPHHGKKGPADGLLRLIDPDFIIITGTENSPEVRESTRFLAYFYSDVPRAYTTRGYLHLMTDGDHWLCEKVDDETLFGALEDVDAPVMRPGR